MNLKKLNENEKMYLIIIVIDLLALTIITWYYNGSATESRTYSAEAMTQALERFNNQFERFKGKQTGNELIELTNQLISNFDTNSSEPSPVIILDNEIIANSDDSQYTSNVLELKEFFTKHQNVIYNVSFNYSTNGFISEIIINENGDNNE